MLDKLWFILIIAISFFGIRFSKRINFKNYNFKNLTSGINKESLFLALGTKMGVGTIIGTTLSIYIGGPSTIIWIYLFTIISSSLIYIESYLGSKYKEKTMTSYIGGIYYYTKKGLKNNDTKLDCLISELQGSINSAWVDGDITEEQCDYLYRKYIRMEK